MSKVIVVGDTFISVDTWRQAVEMMNLPEPVEVVSLEWYPEDSPKEFQRKLKLIEQNGPESLAIPEGFWKK